MLSSSAFHSTLLIGPRCQSSEATGAARSVERLLKLRMSHTLSAPSSPPESSRYWVPRFQEITFTSWSCAASTVSAARRDLTRTSQMRIVRSAEQDANTVGSEGLHWRSSTELVWLSNGVACVVKPALELVVRKILLCTSPVTRRRWPPCPPAPPPSTPPQSIA